MSAEELSLQEHDIQISIELDSNNDLILKLTGFCTDDVRDQVANNINENLEMIAALAFNQSTEEFDMEVIGLERQSRVYH